MFNSAQAIVKYSPRLDNGVYYIVVEPINFPNLTPANYKKPLYGYHIVILNGNLENSAKPLFYGEGAILKFIYSDQTFYSADHKRAMLPVIDFFEDLGNFRESLGLTKRRKGMGWHMTKGYEN